MKSTSQQDRPSRVIYLLRRPDQAGVAVIVAIALVAIGLCLGWRAGIERRLVEFDQAGPRQVKFEVDLNRAQWPELSQLPGIGETLARRIVESRESDGPFANCDELRRVHGIGPKKLEAVRPYLRPTAKMEIRTKSSPQY